VGNELNTDFTIQSNIGNGYFVLPDFVKYGDAMRIKLPHLLNDPNYPDAKNQYLWIENHQIKRITPKQKWIQYQNANFASLGQAETSNAGEQLVRNNLMNRNGSEEKKTSLHPSQSFLFHIPKKTQSLKELIDLNSLNNSLQLIGG